MKKFITMGAALIALTTTTAMAKPYVKANVAATSDNVGLTALTPTAYGVTIGKDYSNKFGVEAELLVNRKTTQSYLNLNAVYTPLRIVGVDTFIGAGVGLADVGVEAFSYNVRAGVSIPVTTTTSVSAAIVHTEVPNVTINNKTSTFNNVQVSFKKSF